MSLLVWLPLIANTKNQGISNPTITTTGTIAYNAGKIGNALTFNNSALTLKPAPLDTNTKEFSFAFWYKPTNGTSYQCLYNGRTAVGSAIAIFRDPSNLWRFDDGSQRTFNYGPTLNEWHHYVFTRDESNVKLYKDGVLQQTMTASSFTCATASASIGMSSVSNATPNANAIIGQVNDYRIYDHVLSVKEIKELAKGLMTHLPMSWGANPNMIKNSYTWMNNAVGTTNGASSTMAVTKSIITDNYAPCKTVLKVVGTNTGSATGTWVGPYFPMATQGLTTTDLVSGETYTYSFWAKLDPSSTGDILFAAGSICESQTHVSNTGFGNLDTNWRLHTVTFKWTSTAKLTACFYTSYAAGTTATYYLCGIKLEKGTVATPYIPHIAEASYTSKGYADMFKMECSGYNRTVTVNSNNTISMATDSPRGTGTNINKTGKLTVTGGMPVGTFPVYTVNAWIRTTTDATQTLWNDFFGIAAKNYACTDSLFRMEVASTTGGSFNWFGPMQKDAGGLFNQGITVGEWTMITLVSDGTKHIGYKNGVQYGTSTPADENKANWATKGDFYIGDSTIYFDVADVRIYSTTLTVDDIKELYQIPAQIDKSGKMYCGSLVEV